MMGTVDTSKWMLKAKATPIFNSYTDHKLSKNVGDMSQQNPYYYLDVYGALACLTETKTIYMTSHCVDMASGCHQRDKCGDIPVTHTKDIPVLPGEATLLSSTGESVPCDVKHSCSRLASHHSHMRSWHNGG